jgi:hypothetical protein
MKAFTAVDFDFQLLEVDKAQVILWKQSWMWCSACDDRTDVDRKQ